MVGLSAYDEDLDTEKQRKPPEGALAFSTTFGIKIVSPYFRLEPCRYWAGTSGSHFLFAT
jgi:hypothetical protein